jgi:intein/homing endonuclease
MIRITSCYLGQVEATPQHKFLVRRTAPSNRVANFVGFDGIKRDVVIHHREKQWVEAKDVKKGDWIYVPKPSAINREGENVIHLSHYACVKSPGLSLGSDGMWRYSRTRKSAIPISDKIGITPELCRFIGYYLAEGYTSNNASMLSLCFNENESEYINECVSVLKDVFGASPTVRKAPGARIINVSSKLLCRLMNGLCGNGADSKHLPRLWDKLSSANLSEIIRGYWRGDGNFSVKRFNAVTVSERLSREIQSALLKLHILCGVSTTFDKDGRVRYNMSIPSRLANRMEAIVGFGVGHVDVKETKAYMRETKRHFLVSVKECEVFQYSGLVYNLKMNGDPSYTANLHGVHNCLRAGQVGEPSYLDTDIRLFHCGSVWH